MELTNNPVEAEIIDLDSEFSRYFSKLNEGFQANWHQKYDAISLAQANNTAASSLRPIFEQLHERLDKICGLYLSTDNSNREAMREYIDGRRSLLLALNRHIGWCSRRVKVKADREVLRRGLAAVSLQDNRLDFRDNYLALGSLYLDSVEAGVIPSVDFYKVGLLSSARSRTSWPTDSTQNFLTRFEGSAYFRESVAPKLLGDQSR